MPGVVFMEGFEEHQTLHAAESIFEGGTLWRSKGYVTDGSSPAIHGKYLHNLYDSQNTSGDMGLVLRDRNASSTTDLTIGFRFRGSPRTDLGKHTVFDILDQSLLPNWETRTGKQQIWVYLEPTATGTYKFGVQSTHVGATTIVESALLEPNEWYYIEVYIKLNGTGNGVVELRVDETVQGSRVTDKRTSGVGSGNWGHIFISVPPATAPAGSCDLDDLWIYDGDHFFGNVTIETVFPDAAGLLNQWTVYSNKTGGDYKAVDDERDSQGVSLGDHDEDTSRLESTSIGQAFDFSMEDFSFLSGNVFAIKFSADMALKNSGSRNIWFSFNGALSSGGVKPVNKTRYHKVEDIQTNISGFSLPTNFSVGMLSQT